MGVVVVVVVVGVVMVVVVVVVVVAGSRNTLAARNTHAHTHAHAHAHTHTDSGGRGTADPIPPHALSLRAARQGQSPTARAVGVCRPARRPVVPPRDVRGLSLSFEIAPRLPCAEAALHFPP